MTAGITTDANTRCIYYSNWSSNPYSYHPNEYRFPPLEKNNRKENGMTISRQTFLDALTDEGKSVSSEGREIVKEAKSDKWELFIARLLARAFESTDLTMLKEKPRQVEVLTKEA